MDDEPLQWQQACRSEQAAHYAVVCASAACVGGHALRLHSTHAELVQLRATRGERVEQLGEAAHRKSRVACWHDEVQAAQAAGEQLSHWRRVAKQELIVCGKRKAL